MRPMGLSSTTAASVVIGVGMDAHAERSSVGESGVVVVWVVVEVVVVRVVVRVVVEWAAAEVGAVMPTSRPLGLDWAPRIPEPLNGRVRGLAASSLRPR